MARTVNFEQALRFPFRGQQAWMNLLLCLVCMMIPIVGAIVVVGYGVLVEKALIGDLQGPTPAFDFGKFGEHLKRGVAPFVVALLMVLVWYVILAVFVGGVILAAVLGRLPTPAIVGVGIAAFFVGLAGIMVSGVFFSPMLLRASLEQKIGAAFGMAFVMDYHKRMWAWEILYALMWMALMLPLLAFMCIPFANYVILPVLTFVGWHVQAQSYREYLARGGTPLNFAPLEMVPSTAFPVVQGVN